MKSTITDFLIIGGGVIGNSIAYHLARQGHQVIVIDKSNLAETPSASWASAGGVRRQGRHPAEAKLASEAITRWKTLQLELEADLGYRQGGNLLLAESDIEANTLSSFVDQQQKMGFSDIRLIDRKEVLAMVPGLNERIVAGSYSPEDGQADPVLTTLAFARAAERYGAKYWTKAYLTGLIRQNDQIVGARTDRGDVRSSQVILSAGAWSDEVITSIGVRLPIRTRALQMILSTPSQKYQLKPVISSVSRVLSLKQVANGGFLLGGG